MRSDKLSSKLFYRDYYRTYRQSAKNDDSDKSISELFVNSSAYKDSSSVFTYYSVGSEVDTRKIIDRALKDGKRVALPKCIDKKGSMEFYFIKDTEESLISGMYSLKEPDASVCMLAESGCDDICLVPGLAFDINGNRLGLGGGYYDRFLSKFKGKTVGLCFEACLCKELPNEEHDIKVNMIITDKKIYDLK